MSQSGETQPRPPYRLAKLAALGLRQSFQNGRQMRRVDGSGSPPDSASCIIARAISPGFRTEPADRFKGLFEQLRHGEE